MAIPPRSALPGTYFVTSATFNRRRLFQLPANARLFIETLQHYRKVGHYKLFGFVVMPDHVHLIVMPQQCTLERTMQLIKGGFSRRIGSKFPVWQRGFTDHRIRDRADFDTRLGYLHDNPVRAKLADRPENYEFSSAFQAKRTDLRG